MLGLPIREKIKKKQYWFSHVNRNIQQRLQSLGQHLFI